MAIYRRHRRAALVSILPSEFGRVFGGEGTVPEPEPALAVTLAARAPDLTLASGENETPSVGEVWFGLVFFLACVIVGVLFIDSDVDFDAPDGVGAFAVFYVVALAIERLLEFLDTPLEWVLRKAGRRESKQILERKRDKAIADITRADAQQNPVSEPRDMDEGNPAAAQAKVNRATKGRSAAIAGLSGGLGMLAADCLNADFLAAIGLIGVSEGVALTATGLVVAGGSKQLHDLITHVSKGSCEKSTPEETRGTASS